MLPLTGIPQGVHPPEDPNETRDVAVAEVVEINNNWLWEDCRETSLKMYKFCQQDRLPIKMMWIWTKRWIYVLKLTEKRLRTSFYLYCFAKNYIELIIFYGNNESNYIMSKNLLKTSFA